MTRIIFDVRAASGGLPETTPVEGAQIDFAPHQARRVEYEGGAYWLTQTIAPVVLPTGAGESDFLPTPVGGAYEVQERVGSGSRSGFVQVPDQDSVRYEDLVWVDGDTLDPIVEPEAAWWATAGQAITDAADAKADASTALGAAEQANQAAGNAEAAAAGAVAESAEAKSTADEALAGLDSKADASSLAPVATSGSASDITTGTLPTSVIPAVAVTDVFPVANQAAMLALEAQKGDVAVRSDVAKTFILASNNPGTLADWLEMPAIGKVQLVNGQQGSVVLGKGDVGLPLADNTADTAKPVSTPQAAADAAVLASAAQFKAWAKNPDLLVAGAVTYTSNLLSSAVVEWPDGKPGVLTITSRQAGTDAVTGYTVTHVDGATTLTYTQPTITRDSSGAATLVPQITVA